MQILPGIYQINGSPYGRNQNSYLVHHKETTILIDSGDLADAETLPEIELNAARWGFQLEEASHLLLTHAHFDHTSHAAELQRRGIKIVASLATAEAIAAGDDRCLGFTVQRVFEPCTADIVIEEGKPLTISDLQINSLAAPGHTEGLVVFEIMLNGERLWFTGDLFEARQAHRSIGLPFSGSPDFDRATYIESVRRLFEFPPCDHILPGHGPACIGNAHRLLDMVYAEARKEWG